MAVTRAEVIDFLSNLTILEMSDLVKELETQWGVSAAAAVAVATGGGESTAAVEEKTEFDVVLTDGGQEKIKVIKVVKDVTGLGLKEAKALVDGAPQVVKQALPKDQAEDLVQKLIAAGAVAEMK
ncbi:50S ribosomal protein L7/L12 [bacterium]|nr:50S ribosomal protein L7/L12 [bacterium]